MNATPPRSTFSPRPRAMPKCLKISVSDGGWVREIPDSYQRPRVIDRS
jgi:hypothetical protein